jgi:tRNA dimethylallyltransferase
MIQPLFVLFMTLSSIFSSHSLLKQSVSLSIRSFSRRNIATGLFLTKSRLPMVEQSPCPPIVVIVAGPTASGKSDVAARLCRQQAGMIVSADSVQAYRGVQIGANKPSQQELVETPHVLIDVADHDENYNAAEWREDAIFCIQTLLLQQQNEEENRDSTSDQSKKNQATKRRRRNGIQTYIQQSRKRFNNGEGPDIPVLPVVCGGTMMYLQWLVHGRPDACRPTPSAIQSSHVIIEKFQQEKNYQGAVEHVSSFGEVFSNRTKQFCGEDWYRLRRTLEIALTVQEQGNHVNMDLVSRSKAFKDDEDASSVHRREQVDALVANLYSGQREGGLSSLGYDVRCFFLCPDNRMSHTQIVDMRCEQMIINGLIKETADLKLSGCLPEMAERAIGYRQTLEYLYKKRGPEESEEDLFETFLNDFTTATRRYAKKQMSWFRKDGEFLFVRVPLEMSKNDRVETVTKEIETYCQLSREEYQKNLEDNESNAARYRKENQLQGKSMKFYHFKRHILKPGSKEYADAFQKAVECREKVRASLSRKRTMEDTVCKDYRSIEL